jgi:hypothetical protein
VIGLGKFDLRLAGIDGDFLACRINTQAEING